MHELRRQIYLSALGIDSYIPRWELVGARKSEFCKFEDNFSEQEPPQVNISADHHSNQSSDIFFNSDTHSVQDTSILESKDSQIAGLQSLESLMNAQQSINDIQPQKKNNLPRVEDFSSNTAEKIIIKPFALSVWRLNNGLMIIDSRDTQQALPTDQLLRNILHGLNLQNVSVGQPEVIRWPLVENRLRQLTKQDAQEEMQTWMSVQCDISSVKNVWLMGELAVEYLLPNNESDTNSVFAQHLYKIKNFNSYKDMPINFSLLVSDSLNDLLKNPLAKKQLLTFAKFLSE